MYDIDTGKPAGIGCLKCGVYLLNAWTFGKDFTEPEYFEEADMIYWLSFRGGLKCT